MPCRAVAWQFACLLCLPPRSLSLPCRLPLDARAPSVLVASNFAIFPLNSISPNDHVLLVLRLSSVLAMVQAVSLLVHRCLSFSLFLAFTTGPLLVYVS